MVTRSKAPQPPRDIDPDDIPKWLAWKKNNPDPVQGRVLRQRPTDPHGEEFPGLRRLDSVAPRKARYLWPGRIPAGMLTVLDGDPGVGKSTLAINLAARVTTGQMWPDGTRCQRGGVVLMTAEEALAETVVPRLMLAGGDREKIWVLDKIPSEDGTSRLPSLPLDIPYIESIIKRYRIRLLIIDVLVSFLGSQVNTHQDADVRRALHPLSAMAERTGCAVLALRHLNKQGDIKNAMYRGGGSIGIAGQARAVYLAAYDPEDRTGQRRIFAPVKLNIAEMPPAMGYRLVTDEATGVASVEWTGESQHTASELLREGLGEDEREDRDQTAEWIQDYLFYQVKHEAPFAEVKAAAARVGIHDRTLKRARRRASVESERRGYQHGTYWVLSQEIVAKLSADPARLAEAAKIAAERAETEAAEHAGTEAAEHAALPALKPERDAT
jgi:RecA-family ATPase